MKERKTESWMRYIRSIKNNTPYNTCWDKIRKIRGTSRKFAISTLVNQANQILSHPKDIANELARAFAKNSSDDNYNEKFLQSIVNYQEPGKDKIFVDTEQPFTADISLAEVKQALKNCKNSSPGPDLIPNEFLKQFLDRTVLYLTDIFNFIWVNMVFPDKWSEALVVPIEKSNKDKRTPSNYRPISLTCTICKLLEKVINKRFKWQLESIGFFFQEQSGFRQFRSTMDHLINFETAICDAFANKQHSTAVALDIEKAYDMMWRPRTIEILLENRTTGRILAFICNFLQRRSIKVRVNEVLSESFEIQNDVPQGSVISATLFLITINEVPKLLAAPVKCELFADGLTIFCSGKEKKTTEKLRQQSINKLQTWTSKTGFKISE